jgi:hypothetical protein
MIRMASARGILNRETLAIGMAALLGFGENATISAWLRLSKQAELPARLSYSTPAGLAVVLDARWSSMP